MKSIKRILSQRDPKKGRYSKHEFQVYGYYLAEQLSDIKHKSLYIKLAKNEDRNILEKALAFVKEANNVKSKAKLFMWRLSQLRKVSK